jgi:sugar phosphate isomerase/epimerase
MTAVRGIGFSTFSNEDQDFEQLRRDIDKAVELGVDFVELPLFCMDVIAGGRILKEQVKRLKSAVEGRGLGVTVHGPIAANFMALLDGVQERHLEVVKAYLEISAELKAAHMVIHTGIMVKPASSQIAEGYERQREALTTLGDFAKALGLILVVENVFVTSHDHYTALPSRLAQEIKAVGHSHVWACLDFSHAAIRCHHTAADFLSEVKALAPVAKHLHIHDSFGDSTQMTTYSKSERVAYGLGDLHLPIGWGKLPWDELMSSLSFADGAIFNLELPYMYRHALHESVEAVRGMASTYKAHQASAVS